ncbi:MAG: putative iron-regulated protein, partial [Alphaproteobacteria bacterium]
MMGHNVAKPCASFSWSWLLASFMVLAACVQTPATQSPNPPPPWQATERINHPLVGKIWRVRDGAFVSPEQLAQDLIRADLVMVGETHDNPDHHQIQAWAVGSLFAAGKQPGIAIEMIRENQQAALKRYLQAHPGDVAGLGPALKWKRSGWAAWRHYAPILAPVAEAALPILGANLPRPMIRAIARQGFAALGPRQAILGLTKPMPDTIIKEMAREIADVHCGQIAAKRAKPFAHIQIARDAVMAEHLTRAARTAGGRGVLIAGSGHVRRDRGVALHLNRQGFSGRLLTLAP